MAWEKQQMMARVLGLLLSMGRSSMTFLALAGPVLAFAAIWGVEQQLVSYLLVVLSYPSCYYKTAPLGTSEGMIVF